MLNEKAASSILNSLKELLAKVITVNNGQSVVNAFLHLAFLNLDSSYQRCKAINNILPVKPKEVGFSTYLPIRPQVQLLMEKSTVFRDSFRKDNIVQNLNQIMSSPLDGFKVYEALRHVPTDYVIPLVIYFDEYCDVCTIGAFTKRNKLSVFEWRVVSRNIATSNNCFLLSFAKSSEFEQCKTTELNKIILEILAETKEPVTFAVEGDVNAQCSIVPIFLSADNLAAHQLIGMFESFSATVPCGKCLVPKSLFASVHRENSVGVRLRSQNQIENQLNQIAEADSPLEKQKL